MKDLHKYMAELSHWFVFFLPVFKFVEQPENNEKPEKTGLKFKIMSLKVKGLIDYVPELVSQFIFAKNLQLSWIRSIAAAP